MFYNQQPQQHHQSQHNHQYQHQQSEHQQQQHQQSQYNNNINNQNGSGYKMMRNVSNSNPHLDKIAPTTTTTSDVHVEYEVSVPIVPSFRHTPYHSLWNLHQW